MNIGSIAEQQYAQTNTSVEILQEENINSENQREIKMAEGGSDEILNDDASGSFNDDEMDDFMEVTGKLCKRTCKGIRKIDISAMQKKTNENKYALLSGLNIECTQPETRNEGVARESSSPKRDYCPPIFLYKVNVKNLVDQLNSRQEKIDFKVKNTSKYKSKLYLRDPIVHGEMMALLREKGIESYSFTPKEYRLVNLVLRGLHFLTGVDEIKAELDEKVPETVHEVTKFSTPRSVRENVDTGLYMVKLLPGKIAGDISGIKYIMNQSVTWEAPKDLKKEVQCKRC